MRKAPTRSDPIWLLGIEGGGTQTRIASVDATGQKVIQFHLGPANLRLLSDAQLLRRFREIQLRVPNPAALGIGLAGARTSQDRTRIRLAATRVWPGVPCGISNDLEIALQASEVATGSRKAPQPDARVLVLSGTGSCCFGRTPKGATAKVGGWGHLLGDQGSGYAIGLSALRSVIHAYDQTGVWPTLGQQLLRALQMNDPEELIDWIQQAGKTKIAALAPVLFASTGKRQDKIARQILDTTAQTLVSDALDCARRLVKSSARVEFVLAGGNLVGQPQFGAKVARQLRKSWPSARVIPLQTQSVWGAVELARAAYVKSQPCSTGLPSAPLPSPALAPEIIPAPFFTAMEWVEQASTEQRHPLSTHLDTLPLEAAISLMLREDARMPLALLRERKKIAQGIRLIVRAFRRGGRLFYVGAGTSGRLGVLDASECPPTFQTDPNLVQGIIAGGPEALWQSVEGAEDDPQSGAHAVIYRGVNNKDVVVGIAASGRTPFVWGALREAALRRATTLFVCFNPNLKVPRSLRPTLCIAPRIGPEILTGSTRLKAGTATKLILNMFTTLTMVQLGKVISNLMVDVKPSNMKLRNRAIRIVQILTGNSREPCQAALEKSDWNIRTAIRRLRQTR